MNTSRHQDKAEPQCSEQSNLCRPEEMAKFIEHLKQIADNGDFVEL
jgi:hypothetical protein